MHCLFVLTPLPSNIPLRTIRVNVIPVTLDTPTSCTATLHLRIGAVVMTCRSSLQDAIAHLCLNTLRPRQNGRHLSDDIFIWIFFRKNIYKFWLRFHRILFPCSKGSSQQYSSNGSDNGLAPTKRQTIIWSNDGKFTDAYVRHSGPTG